MINLFEFDMVSTHRNATLLGNASQLHLTGVNAQKLEHKNKNNKDHLRYCDTPKAFKNRDLADLDTEVLTS